MALITVAGAIATVAIVAIINDVLSGITDFLARNLRIAAGNTVGGILHVTVARAKFGVLCVRLGSVDVVESVNTSLPVHGNEGAVAAGYVSMWLRRRMLLEGSERTCCHMPEWP